MTTANEVMSEIRYGLSELGASCDFNVTHEAVSADGTAPLVVLRNDAGERFTVVVVAGDVVEDLQDGASLDCLIDEEYED